MTGIFFDPGSDGATIGGSAASERNVISGNEGDGLDLNGACETTIQGNYFGVSPPEPLGLPGGSTQIANGKDIEITDSTAGVGASKPKKERGRRDDRRRRLYWEPSLRRWLQRDLRGEREPGSTSTATAAGQNEAPASWLNLVHGNYVGLAADGETVVPNAEYGVLAGGADEVEIGGIGTTKRNYFTGGLYGVYGENGEDFAATFDWIGRDGQGEPASAPAAVGIFNISNGITEPGRIVQNTLEMSSGVAIEQRFTGAAISFNKVFGGDIGILTRGSSVGEGNRISINEIHEADGDGILIENDSNVVVGNEVKEAGGDGIHVRCARTLPLAAGTTRKRDRRGRISGRRKCVGLQRRPGYQDRRPGRNQ